MPGRRVFLGCDQTLRSDTYVAYMLLSYVSTNIDFDLTLAYTRIA